MTQACLTRQEGVVHTWFMHGMAFVWFRGGWCMVHAWVAGVSGVAET